jgi:hypothetical protein
MRFLLVQQMAVEPNLSARAVGTNLCVSLHVLQVGRADEPDLRANANGIGISSAASVMLLRMQPIGKHVTQSMNQAK